MELNWLEDFVALADCGNFSRAAEARGLTQPAFSRRIRALEEWVGTPLFDRSAAPVRLTKAGSQFRPAAEETLRGLAQGRRQARMAAAVEAGTLTFAATHALSLTFFPEWLRGVEARAPLGAVHLISENMRACEDLMVEGQAQFLLCHRHAAVPTRLDPARFRGVAVGTDLLVPVAAPSAGLLLDGSATVPFLAYSEESGISRIIATALKAMDLQVALETVFTSHLATVQQAMARDGRGVAWLPFSLVAADLDSGRLVRAGDEGWDIPVQIQLIRPRSRQTAAAETFWSLLSVQGNTDEPR